MVATTHPCGCPAGVDTTPLTWGGQCSSCGSRWDGEGTVFMLIEGPLNKATYTRITLERIDYNAAQAEHRIDGLRTYLADLARQREALTADQTAKNGSPT